MDFGNIKSVPNAAPNLSPQMAGIGAKPLAALGAYPAIGMNAGLTTGLNANAKMQAHLCAGVGAGVGAYAAPYAGTQGLNTAAILVLFILLVIITRSIYV
ncbi:hypothetical protein [Paenibacillus turpanensis]|uniref:hypothetical protein n=1 Tax=Paenibacillus turpanensis TaxID=2689078 RepID=UPI00140B9F7C|nr:hypothetical protein [Paenibacillus turpanensis]